MQIHGIDELLAAHPLFRDFDAETHTMLAGCARNEHFHADQTIYREGDPAEKVYVLRRGDVAIEISAPERPAIIVETLHAGDLLGWGWMVAPYTAMSDARAITEVSAISLDANCVRGKCDDHPVLGYRLFQSVLPHLAARVRAQRLQLLDLYGTSWQ